MNETRAITGITVHGLDCAIWMASVEAMAKLNPTAISRAFRRSGAGKSLMLAAIAPSVAGCPAPNPKIAEAPSVTTATQNATLRPLTMCWPTNSLSSLGERDQASMARSSAPPARVNTQCAMRCS